MVTSLERPWDVVMEKMLSFPKKKNWCSERTKENRTSAGIAEDDQILRLRMSSST